VIDYCVNDQAAIGSVETVCGIVDVVLGFVVAPAPVSLFVVEVRGYGCFGGAVGLPVGCCVCLRCWRGCRGTGFAGPGDWRGVAIHGVLGFVLEVFEGVAEAHCGCGTVFSREMRKKNGRGCWFEGDTWSCQVLVTIFCPIESPWKLAVLLLSPFLSSSDTSWRA